MALETKCIHAARFFHADLEDDTQSEAIEERDIFADEFDVKSTTSVRTPDRRRTSVSTKMLACVEAEGALELALDAVDQALQSRARGNPSLDFRTEIAALKKALGRAEKLFSNKEVTSSFFSADHVKEVRRTIAEARSKLTTLNSGDMKSLKRLNPTQVDPEPRIAETSKFNFSQSFPEFEDGLTCCSDFLVFECLVRRAPTQLMCRIMLVGADLDDYQKNNADREAIEERDIFADEFDVKSTTSVRTPDRRRTSVSTKMLACVEAEGALELALDAVDQALQSRARGNPSLDFRTEIAALKKALGRAEKLFSNKEVTSSFFSADHVKEVQTMVTEARRKLQYIETEHS